MELDNFLHKIQGILKHEEKLLGPLNMLKKENEEDVSKIVGSLIKVIGDEEFNMTIQQKLYVLLFLNTDTDNYNDLKKNRKYTHLVGFFPKLSRDLFIKIVIGLKLHHCVYESVQHFCSSLSYQVLDMCLHSLNWIDLFEAISFVENLLTSLFRKIVIIDDKDKFDIHLKDAFQRLLLHYDAEKGGTIKRMSLWKSSKMKHYSGLVMGSLLSLLENCTKIFCKKDVLSADDANLFNIQIDQESLEINVTVKTESRLITVQECYEHVVSKCLENFVSVTLDLWIFWVEVDLDDIPDTENTLQRYVGEKSYTCRETLKEAECLGISSKGVSDLISKLKTTALKPHTEENQASSMNLEQVLTNIQDPNKDRQKWIKFLLNNALFAVEHSALELLKKYIHCLQTADVLKLSKLLFTFIKNNENCTSQKNFVLEMVKSLDVDCQMEVSQCFVEICGLTEILKTEEFQPIFVETFNKVINEEDKEKELYPQFLSLALQSAESVVSRAVAEGITSEVRGHLMADILARLQAFCDATRADNNPLLIGSLHDLLTSLPNLPDNQRANYPLFVRELVMRKNLDGERFIDGCMKAFHEHLKKKDLMILIICLETLSELYAVDCIPDCPATVFMLLQVIQANRWTPATFSMAAVKVCEAALELIENFVAKWIDTGVEDGVLRNVATLVVKRINPLNRYHLYRLLTDEQMPVDPGMKLVYRIHYGVGEWSIKQVTPEERLKLIYALCYVLPVLTTKEWKEMFCVIAPKCSEFLFLFHIVTDSILVCLDTAKIKADEAVMSCLCYTIVNVAEVVKNEMTQWTKNDNEYRISVLRKMCQLISNLPLSHQETFGLTLIKLLQQLLPEGSRRKPLTAQEMNSVTASIASIQTPNLRQSLSKEFVEMIHR